MNPTGPLRAAAVAASGGARSTVRDAARGFPTPSIPTTERRAELTRTDAERPGTSATTARATSRARELPTLPSTAITRVTEFLNLTAPDSSHDGFGRISSAGSAPR